MNTRADSIGPLRALGLLAALALLVAPALVGASVYQNPLLSNDVRTTVQGTNSSLDIYLVPVCADDEQIEVQVTYEGRPVAGVELTLYNYSRGRRLDSITQTLPTGWAAFRRRPAGSYDLVAEVVNETASGLVNDTMGQIYFRIPPCLSPASGAPFGDLPNASTEPEPLLVQNGTGWAREFYLITLPNGVAATRVRVRLHLANQTGLMVEPLPDGMALSPSALGFESDYPDDIQTGPTRARLAWAAQGSGDLWRSYVLTRPLSIDLAQRWQAPSLQAPASSPLNASNVSTSTPSSPAQAPLSSPPASTSNSTRPPAPAPSAPASPPASPSQDSALAQIGAGVVLVLLLGLVAAGAWAAYTRLSCPKKKE